MKQRATHLEYLTTPLTRRVRWTLRGETHTAVFAADEKGDHDDLVAGLRSAGIEPELRSV